ncbi:MAG: polysaccharide deacetylase family protein [Phycisphaerae bacterium]|nr:polysaccharide deacetylase family protein [Phycisphaerae bacterium]
MTNLAIRTLAVPALSLLYRRARGMVLVYHEILPPGGRAPHTSTQMTLADFRAQLAFITSTCRVMALDAFLAALSERRLPSRACVLTFDDGFRDNYEVALPVLREFGVPATFFVASGYVAAGRPYEADALHDILRLAPPQAQVELDLRPWGGSPLQLSYSEEADRRFGYFKVAGIFKNQIPYTARREVIDYLADRFGVDRGSLALPAMMTPEQVRGLAEAGMTIGSHTEWHISLTADGPEEYARQLAGSRRTLEEMTGQPVGYFSYPFGDPQFCVSARELVREAGYVAAFMGAGSAAELRHGPWLVDRLATSGGMLGLAASLLGIKPSQFRQRRAFEQCLAEAESMSPSEGG